MTTYFRMLAACSRVEAQATLLAGISILGKPLPRPLVGTAHGEPQFLLSQSVRLRLFSLAGGNIG